MNEVVLSHDIVKIVAIRKYAFIFLMLANAFFAPLLGLLALKSYQLSLGIILESGCHGPEMSFGLLSGIFMALQLKYIKLS